LAHGAAGYWLLAIGYWLLADDGWRLAAGADDSARPLVLDQPVEQAAQRGLLVGAEAVGDLLVALLDQRHRALPGRAAGLGQREHHAAAVARMVPLVDQALGDQRLRGAAGLALVQVGLLRQVIDRQRLAAADAGQPSAIAHRQVGLARAGRLASKAPPSC